jgi:hypothetical protein
MQQPPLYPNYPPYEEEEINLLDYLIVLLKYKWLIFGIVFVTGVAAVIISLRMPNIYRSEATIIPRQQEKSATSSALSALGAVSGMAGELVGLGGGGGGDIQAHAGAFRRSMGSFKERVEEESHSHFAGCLQIAHGHTDCISRSQNRCSYSQI